MAKVPLTAPLRSEYEGRFDTCQIRAERLAEVNGLVARIAAARSRYEAIQLALGIPWHFVAVIHCLECSLDFNRHLHNGDSLAARTVRVPAGRPAAGNPPFTWEISATDALRLRGLDRWGDWSVGGLLYQLEGYNGWGYRLNHPEVATPYLWSYSNHYTRGKYVADHQWSTTAASKQCGAAVLLRRMVEQSIIRFASAPPAPVNGAAVLTPTGPLISYWSGGPEIAGARTLQEFLNRMPGIFIQVDGKPGEETSNALRRVTGHYLVGDPRVTG